MKKIKFLRRNTREYSRLGKGRKKLQKWRKPKGRDNKMRLRRKGVPRTVEIGYKQDAQTRGKIKGKKIVVVRTISELKKANGKIIVLGKIGIKKKIEIAKFAKEKKIEIMNLDIGEFLRGIEEAKKKEKVEDRKKDSIEEKKEEEKAEEGKGVVAGEGEEKKEKKKNVKESEEEKKK